MNYVRASNPGGEVRVTQVYAVVTYTNNAPAITSNGGGATASVNLAENATAVTTVTATDVDAGQTLTYSISGGADAAKFSINPSTGALTFLSAPDFETPTDAGANNVYDVTVQVTDNGSPTASDTQVIAVTVTDVVEAVCVPAAPAMTIVEAPKSISVDNGNAAYTVNITNNDSAVCGDTTFTLSASDNNANFYSQLSVPDVTLAPAANTSVTLTVYEDTATSGTSTTTTVTATASGHSDGTAQVTTSFSLVPAGNALLHNSTNTGSGKWPTAQSGKAVDGWGIAGAKYGEFTCGTCHAKNTGNIKRIRTTLAAPDVADQFPIQAAAGTVSFQATAGPNSFGDDGRADQTKSSQVCAVCHSKTAVHRYDLTTVPPVAPVVTDFNHKNANQTDCIACHQHKVGFKPSGCNTCHGEPPTSEAELVTGANDTGSATAGAHLKHAGNGGGQLAYACNTCHSGYTMPAGGIIDISFSTFGAPPGSYTGQVGVDYNFGPGAGGLTCNSVYCHSTGQSANGTSATPSAYSAPAWNGTAACGSCHSNTDPATGSHTVHVNAGATCVTCHAGNAHVNRVIDVGIGTYTAAGAPGNGYGTCSTANCHDPGRGALVTTPTWGTTSACAECHLLQPGTGSHAAHLSAGSSCGDCHQGAVEGANAGVAHRNTTIETVATLGYPTPKAKNSAFTTCATASCHDTGRNSGGLTAAWGTTLNDCSECHPTVPATAGHATHLGKNFKGVAIVCVDCHAGTTQGTTAGAGHRDGDIDALGYDTQNKALDSAYTTCSTASCHREGLSTDLTLPEPMDYVTTPAWDQDTANCTQCHAAVPATGSHAAHVTTAGKDCNACHTGATKDTSYNSAQHGDLNIDVAVGGYAPNKAIASAYTNCTNLACHSDGMAATGNSPVWGSSAGCTSCHLSDMVTGSHGKHLAEAGAGCGDCHADAVKDSTAPTGGVHADGNVDVYTTAAGDLGYPNNVAYGSATWTTCTAASCHDMGRGGLATTPAWGVSKTDCTECHAGATIATGSHAAHLGAGATCASCHDDAYNPATEGKPATGHRDTNIDTDLALGYPQDKAKNIAFTTCATASCHNTGRNSGLTATWGTTLNNCSECHPTVPATAGHAAHLGKNFAGVAIACDDCHIGTVQGTTAPTANHRDGNTDAVGYPVSTNGGAYLTCTTASCHREGLSTVLPDDYVTTPAWDANTANCTQCHSASPTTGSHAKHIATTGNCSTCHGALAVKDTSYDSAQHGDLNIDVAVGSYAADKAIASAYTNCTNISCHSDGLSGIPGDTPVWGTTAGCAACHEANMITGSHTIHLAEAGVGCDDCHDDADPATSNPPAQHTDGNVDVFNAAAGDLGYPQNAAIGSASWTTCSAASCHDNGTGTPGVSPAWGTVVSDCSECHPTVPTTGSHTKHLVTTAYELAECGDCHGTTVQGTTAPAGHRDGDLDVFDSAAGDLGYPQDVAKGGAPYNTCSTVYCHSPGQNATGGVLGAGDYATVTWGGTAACGSCHKVSVATGLTSGSHAVHLGAAGVGCDDCHTGAAANASSYNSTNHNNRIMNVSGAYTAGGIMGNGYGTCSTAVCHDNGTGVASVSPTWGATVNDCSECHARQPATGAHTAHLTGQAITSTIACAACHAGAVEATTAPAQHLDGNVDVYKTAAGDLGYTIDKTKGSAYVNCTTAYCHSNGKGAYQSISWGATISGCAACHGNPPAVGHPANSDCSACHLNVVAADNEFIDDSKHINGIVEAEGGDSCLDCHGVGKYKNPLVLHPDHADHTDVSYFLAGKGLAAGDYGKLAASGTNSLGWYDVKYSASGTPVVGCGQCHSDVLSNHLNSSVDMDLAKDMSLPDPNAKRNNTVGAIYSAGQCSGVYCHSDGINDGTYPNTPTWGSGTITNCAGCHGNSPTTNGNVHGVHAVGIHYNNLYDDDGDGLMPAAAAPGTDPGAAHGNSGTAAVIGCQTCHNSTVSSSFNAGSNVCGSCHTSGDGKVGSTNASIKASSTAHLNGAITVTFASLDGFKSKAQLRDDITTVPEVNSNWGRTTGYKNPAGSSYDAGKAVVPSYSGGAYATGTCSSISCHNGYTTPAWNTGVTGNCGKCHTLVPR